MLTLRGHRCLETWIGAALNWVRHRPIRHEHRHRSVRFGWSAPLDLPGPDGVQDDLGHQLNRQHSLHPSPSPNSPTTAAPLSLGIYLGESKGRARIDQRRIPKTPLEAHNSEGRVWRGAAQIQNIRANVPIDPPGVRCGSRRLGLAPAAAGK